MLPLSTDIPTCPRGYLGLCLPASLVSVFLFLRPQDLLENHRPEHRSHYEKPEYHKYAGENTSDDLDGIVI